MRARCRWDSHPKSLCAYARLLLDRLQIKRLTWTGLQTTEVPLDDVVRSEWWTGECDYNLGIYLRGGDRVLLYVRGAARWKFAIDERIVALGREHRGLPRVTKTRVRAAHGAERRQTTPPAPARQPTAQHHAQADSGDHVPEGDHLPENVELTLGDGSKRPLSEASEIIVQPRAAVSEGESDAEETYLRVPLSQVRTVRLEHGDRAIRLRFQHASGSTDTVVEVDEDARIELMR
jgi:hypothetical protein